MTDIALHIQKLLEAGIPVALATVLSHSGSTPRGAGTKMLIRPDGSIIGTIGGGSVEAEVIRNAGRVLETGRAVAQRFDFSTTDLASSLGMVCGGKMRVLIEPIPADRQNILLFQQLAACIRSGATGLLGRLFTPGRDGTGRVTRFIVSTETSVSAISSRHQPLITTLEKDALSRRAPSMADLEEGQLILDPFFSAACVYLFGAGHVSRAAATVLHLVDFKTVVIDDRRAFANRTFFPQADDIIVPESFDTAFSDLCIDARSLIVIITRGMPTTKQFLNRPSAPMPGISG